MADWDALDEILFLDGDGMHQTVDDHDQVTVDVFFADGSKMTIITRVPEPPKDVLTEETLTVFSLATGEKTEEPDRGVSESMEIILRATASRVTEKVLAVLAELPERDTVTCPVCDGDTICQYCGGKGCVDCDQDGWCLPCRGRGYILKAIDD